MTSKQLKIKVKTTWPILPLAPITQREIITTERLILRPSSQDDLDGYHSLRTQPEVMAFNPAGRPDRDLAETQARLDNFIPPNDLKTFHWTIFLASTREFIGVGGVHNLSSKSGWPVISYMIKREHWSKGYATESMRACVDAWWKLPRAEVEIESGSASSGYATEAIEQLYAFTTQNNTGSLGVITKLGFQKFREWQEQDSRAGYEDQFVTLIGFVLQRPIM